MADKPIIVTGGSLTVKLKGHQFSSEVAEADGHKYEHEVDGTITRIEVKSGSGDDKIDLNIPILDGKHCEITIRYDV
jgi:hypothetical protein